MTVKVVREEAEKKRRDSSGDWQPAVSCGNLNKITWESAAREKERR